MLALYLGLYTIVLALVWGMFIVVKIHAYKFKNFSSNIPKFGNILLIFLIILSVIGYVSIFLSGVDSTDVKVNSVDLFETKEINY